MKIWSSRNKYEQCSGACVSKQIFVFVGQTHSWCKKTCRRQLDFVQSSLNLVEAFNKQGERIPLYFKVFVFSIFP